jgi:hypothetical protein
MASEDNIRRLRHPEKNVFEELEEHERMLEERRRRLKEADLLGGRGKTAELNIGNRGYIWARRQRKAPPRSGDNDT